MATMTDDYKKALYEAFLKDTPIKYDQVTDEQWESMHNTVTGAVIALSQTITKAFEPVAKVMNEILKRVKL